MADLRRCAVCGVELAQSVAEGLCPRCLMGHAISDGPAAVAPGARLGHYEVVAMIGRGGMGEVYRARDTKLGRDVALKILPESVTGDPNRVARFRREAHVLAALNHPNIGSIYGLDEADERQFLVLELVDGETLAHRLRRGPLSVSEALTTATQIANALEAANEKGIVHRDLKPANIALARGGVKVLDFGIAKATDVGGADDETFGVANTRPGVMLGSAAYMSPEQACGEAVDKRADVWAFGAVLYEMLAGRAAFARDTAAETFSAILSDQPDWTRLPAAVPGSVQRLLRRCLERDPRRRLHDIADARLEIEDALAPSPGIATPAGGTRAWKRRTPWTVAALAVLLAGLFAFERLQSRPSSPAVASIDRFTELLPSDTLLAPAPALAISADGRRMAYVGLQNGTPHLYVRDLDQQIARPLAGTDGADQPFFSPDGRWIGFFADRMLKKIAVAGGTPIVLCAAPAPRGGTWTPDNAIIFAPLTVSALMRVAADGGTPQPLTRLDRSANEASHRWPEIAADRETLLYAAGPTVSAFAWNEAHIVAQSLRSGERRIVLPHGTFPRLLRPGVLLYAHDQIMFAQAFDAQRLSVSGDAVAVLTPISQMGGVNGGAPQFAVSPAGTLIYGVVTPREPESLVWVDRTGRVEPIAMPPGQYSWPRLSPDGRQVALTVVNASDSDIWLYDLARGIMTRLTSGGRNLWPTWTPDGTRVTYASSREGSTNVFWKRADGNGREEQLTSTQYTNFPQSWSGDGRMLAMSEVTDAGGGLAVLSLGAQKTPQRIYSRPNPEGQFSPDGRWIAYTSTESGRNEVSVRPYPGPGSAVQISTSGGSDPVWARSGREVFFVRGDAVMAAGVTIRNGALEAATPKVLFSGSYALGGVRPGYDVSHDGQRFLTITLTGGRSDLSRFNVALHWQNEVAAKLAGR